MQKLILSCAVAVFSATICHAVPTYPVLTEGFSNVSALSGWVKTNRSSPVGSTDWFQGNSMIFPAQAGVSSSYAAANFLAAGSGGDISDWLISPLVTLQNGDLISFFTRTVSTPAVAADRLELRLNTTGSTNVGTTAASTGDFSTLLVSVNSALSLTGYPAVWTQYSATVTGLSGPTASRFAFRYFVPDTSINGDYIGIDTVSVLSEVPEPSTYLTMSGAAAFFLFAGLRRKRKQVLSPVPLRALMMIAAAVSLSALVAPAALAAGKPAKTKQTRRSQPKAAPQDSALRATVDPETGELREPMASSSAARRSAPVPSATVVINNPDGSRTAILGDDYMSYSVARIQPDGSVAVSHASPEEARKIGKAARKGAKK